VAAIVIVNALLAALCASVLASVDMAKPMACALQLVPNETHTFDADDPNTDCVSVSIPTADGGRTVFDFCSVEHCVEWDTERRPR
jgi:hypothetical protein